MNTESRKLAKSEFENSFYKLMNNSVFGKTMENMQERGNIKIVGSDERKKIRKLIASPLFAGCTLFSNDLAGFKIHKECAKLDKPGYAAMTILDNRKILMYDFCYNELKSHYSHKGELLYTDTDSLLLEIEIDDF